MRTKAAARIEQTIGSPVAPVLTRQVLSSTVTIRLGGSRAALRRQIKLTLTAAFESLILQRINEGGGDSGARWHL